MAFLYVFPSGVSAVVLFFFFWGCRASIYVEKQVFRHLFSTVRSRFSVFWYRLLASSADIGKSLSAEWFFIRLKAIPGNAAWKQKMSFLHGFLLTFGFSWQEFPFLGLWCKRGGCCLFAGIFISFPDILSARKCWLVRLSVMPDFSFFWPDSGCMPWKWYKKQNKCNIGEREILFLFVILRQEQSNN